MVITMVICCSQFLVIDADAAGIAAVTYAQTSGWLSSLFGRLFSSKKDVNTEDSRPEKISTEETKTNEAVANIIVGTPNVISQYDAYRNEVEKIDNSALRNTPQLERLTSGNKVATGICNVCSLETLLNRRVAYDFGDYSSPFDDYDMFQAIGVHDAGNGKLEYKKGRFGYCLLDKNGGEASVGSAQENTLYRYSDSIAYRTVQLRTTEVEKMAKETGLTGSSAQYAVIAAILREHPEGIWIRSRYGTHAIVITDYEEKDGVVQLYGIDPVNVLRGTGRSRIEDLNFYTKCYKNGLIGGGPYNIAYLKKEGTPDEKFTVPSAPSADGRTPTLQISGQKVPESLNQGGNFGLRGTITTDCGVITSVYGEITDLSGNVIQSGQHTPNTTSDNLRYSINNDLVFDRLNAGSYVYRVQATAKNGDKETTQTLIDCQFQVQGAQGSNPTPAATAPATTEPAATAPASQTPSVWLSNETLPGSLQQGSNFGIRGTVSTDCGSITYLRGSLVDAAGREVQSGQYYPNASSVDLRYTINNDLIFGNLPAGEYTYIVDATAQNGSEQTTRNLIRHVFQVVAPSETEPARTPVLSISGQNLPQDQKLGANFGIRGTISTDCGTITELYGAILDANGNTVCSGWYTPNSTTVDLRTTINNDLVFGTLSAGSYTYYVQARAENNGQQTVQTMIEHGFTVSAAESQQTDPALISVGYNMTVNVGKGSTLRFCSTVSTADQYEIGSLPNNAVVYVYGYTQQQYEGRTWAKISYNGTDGWVNYKWLA